MSLQSKNPLRNLLADSPIVMWAGTLCGSVLLALGGCGKSPEFTDSARLVAPAQIEAHVAAQTQTAPVPQAEPSSTSTTESETRTAPVEKKKKPRRRSKRKTALTYKIAPSEKKRVSRPISVRGPKKEAATPQPAPVTIRVPASLSLSPLGLLKLKTDWVEKKIAGWEIGASEVVETFKPIETSLEEGLSESPQLTEVSTGASPVQLDPTLLHGEVMPREGRIIEKVGEYQLNKFPQIRAIVAESKQGVETLLKQPIVAPRSKRNPLPTLAAAPVLAVATPSAPATDLVAVEAKAKNPSTSAPVTLAAITPATAVVEDSTASEVLPEPAPAPTETTAAATEGVASTEAPVLDATQALASSEPVSEATRLLSPALASTAGVVTAIPGVVAAARSAVTTQSLAPTQTTQVAEAQSEPEALPDQLYVRPRFADDKATDVEGMKFSEWLEKTQGHLEFYLHPEGSREQQDAIHLTCSRPEHEYECQADTREMRGTYQLMANVFTPNERFPYGQFEHSEKVTAENARGVVSFVLDGTTFKRRFNPPAGKADQVRLLVAVFEAPVPEIGLEQKSDFTNPKHIQGAKVRLIGFPELAKRQKDTSDEDFKRGVMQSDRLGTVRFPAVPIRSQYLLHVTAPGYLPVYKPVSVFTTHAYETIHLLPERLRGNARSDTAVVLGRVFDPVSRRPVAGLPMSMKRLVGDSLNPDDSEPLLYATSPQGLFGWTKIKRGFRSILRDESSAPLQVFARAGAGTYVEINRGGARNLYGRFEEAFSQKPVLPAVRLFGDAEDEGMVSDPKGRFMIPKIGFSPGVITIASAAEGYVNTLHTLPWNALERPRIWRLPMLPKESLQTAVQSAARSGGVQLDDRAGVIAGYANDVFLRKQTGCLYAQLIDANGSEAPASNGPFPYFGELNRGARLCLDGHQSGAVFINLPDGQYVWRWTDAQGQPVRGRIVEVHSGYASILNN